MSNESLSPEGAAADHGSEKDCRRPFGAQGCCETGDLGLTPQATCRCPFRGKNQTPRPVYKRVVLSRGAERAVDLRRAPRPGTVWRIRSIRQPSGVRRQPCQ